MCCCLHSPPQTEARALFKTPAEYFQFYANESIRGGSPLYQKLSLGLADDPELQSITNVRQQGQPAANLIFGAAHYLLLSGVEDKLADYFPSIGGTRAVDDEAYPLFRAFCEKHKPALQEIIAKRVTNTNEVGRSALLAPAFQIISRVTERPLALIEIGSSAGLNLNFDRYGYRYVGEDGTPRLERWLDAEFALECTLKGDLLPELHETPPEVGSRLGLELAPIDITKEEERLWLKALVWPERTDRFARLEGALKIALQHPPTIKGGDATRNLAEALSKVKREQVRCVYHTVMFYQLSREQSDRVHHTLLQASTTGPIFRVSVEGQVKPDRPLETHNPLMIGRYINGKFDLATLGICDPHGTWLEWTAKS